MRGTRILLMEDNEIDRKWRSASSRMPRPSSTSPNGAIALEMIQGNDYDAVLMDMQMPVMDGIEATRVIGPIPATKSFRSSP